jgi:hypothetical protein
MGMAWVTPELLVLKSGSEAEFPASGKHQPVTEGQGDSCAPGVGCPGEEDLDGPS